MIGEILHYGMDILFTLSALILFLFLGWKRKLDWSETPSSTLFMEDRDE